MPLNLPRHPVIWSSPIPLPLMDLCFCSSMAQRADLLELDCQLTRDGVVVVSHDKNLSRQSGVNRDVSSLDFEVGLPPPHHTQKAPTPPCTPPGDSPLPSLGAAPLQGRAGGFLLTR